MEEIAAEDQRRHNQEPVGSVDKQGEAIEEGSETIETVQEETQNVPSLPALSRFHR